MTDSSQSDTQADQFDLKAFSEAFHEEFEKLPAANRFSPEQLEVIYGMGYAHAQQKQWEQALPIFAFLSQYGPSRRHYLAGLAQCTRELGRLDEAKNVYALMLTLFPDHLEPGVQLAECQLALGEVSAALTTLNLLLEISEDGSSLKRRVQSFLDRLGSNLPQSAP
ncbi:tetratricopeptide repeat protein [Ottowia thiooxydans]|uniref:Type III secretion system low calcium response chaperone LcrH/SycD n=1 Tax=Ottowia thiooxydans TaxID=219182 RepID=A0ABV2QGD1_9BURK